MLIGGLIAILALFGSSPSEADDVLARSRATYAALKSYSDSGRVDYEYGPAAAPLRERYTFTTLFRAPRHLLFDFTKGSPGGRFVVWGDGEVFHSWWAATGVEDTYPRGKGATAFVISTQPTAGSSVVISPLLFPGAGLIGTLEELADTTVEGTEMIDGHTCHKLVGVARSRYGSGNETNVRRTIVWIDAETLLVRRVFEDAPRGTASGIVARKTTTFEPKANPVLDEARFRFTPPAAQR
jgi:outer membrane lipoprotein-sorting protein